MYSQSFTVAQHSSRIKVFVFTTKSLSLSAIRCVDVADVVASKRIQLNDWLLHRLLLSRSRELAERKLNGCRTKVGRTWISKVLSISASVFAHFHQVIILPRFRKFRGHTSYFDLGDLQIHLICVCSTLTLTFHEARIVLDCSWWTITGFNPLTVTPSIYSGSLAEFLLAPGKNFHPWMGYFYDFT